MIFCGLSSSPRNIEIRSISAVRQRDSSAVRLVYPALLCSNKPDAKPHPTSMEQSSKKGSHGVCCPTRLVRPMSVPQAARGESQLSFCSGSTVPLHTFKRTALRMLCVSCSSRCSLLLSRPIVNKCNGQVNSATEIGISVEAGSAKRVRMVSFPGGEAEQLQLTLWLGSLNILPDVGAIPD